MWCACCVLKQMCHNIGHLVSYKYPTIQQCALMPQATMISLSFFNPLTLPSLHQSLSASFLWCRVCLCVLWSLTISVMCLCVLIVSDVTLGQQLSSAMLSVSLSVCRSVCCLFCVVSTLFDCYQTSMCVRVCVFECVYMSSVSVFLQNQTSNRESQVGTYTHCIKMRTHTVSHRTSSPIL